MLTVNRHYWSHDASHCIVPPSFRNPIVEPPVRLHSTGHVEAPRTQKRLASARCHSEHQRELPLRLGHELVARRQELEDGDHGLAGLLTDPLAIALDEFKAEGQGVGVLS